VIVPPMPAFYNHPESVSDIVDHLVARVLDQFGIEMSGAARWSGMRQTGNGSTLVNNGNITEGTTR